MPRNPELLPVGRSVMPDGGIAGIEVHVVVEVRELPLEARSVGEYADLVLVEMRHAVDDFQHDLPSRSLSDAPVHDRTFFQRDDTHRCYGGLHFVDRGELRQHPCRYLQIGQRAVVAVGVVGFVASVLREEEEAGRESRLVDSLGDELLLLHGQPDRAVSGGEGQSVRTGWGERPELLAARDDDVLASENAARPFDRARLHVTAVGGRECDAGAGARPVKAAAEGGDR